MEIEDRIRFIFAAVMSIPVEQVNQSCSPDTVPTWDSLRQMNLVSAVEEEFEIVLSFEETTMLTDYESLLDLVRKKISPDRQDG